MGKEVRAAIQRIGGTMPEELPPAEDIKKMERRVASEEKIIEKPGTELSQKRLIGAN